MIVCYIYLLNNSIFSLIVAGMCWENVGQKRGVFKIVVPHKLCQSLFLSSFLQLVILFEGFIWGFIHTPVDINPTLT